MMNKFLPIAITLFFFSFAGHSQHAANALSLGTIDYVEVPDNSDGTLDINNGFTFEAWILTGNAQFNQKVGGKIGGDFANGFIFGIQDGEVNFEVFDTDNNQTVLQTGVVPDTTWTHVAGTYEVGGMLTIYVNGISAGATAASSGDHTFNENPFRIGIAPWDVNALGFFGLIDELKYWNEVLDESVIRDWMHKDLDSNHPNIDNLGIYHKYDEVSGEIAGDLSGNNNSGMLIGGTWEMSIVPFKGFFDLFENAVRGVWPGQTQASSDIMTLTGTALEGDQSIVFAHSSDNNDFSTDVPGLYTKRLSRIWRGTTQGTNVPIFEAQFDLTGIDLTGIIDYALLISDTPEFANASHVTGTLDGTTVSIPEELYSDGSYYTLGFLEEGVSVDELYDSANDFRIEPNPSQGQIRITLENETFITLNMSVMDLKGQVVFQQQLEANQGTHIQPFDFSQFAKGMYLIQLTDSNRSSTRKFIIH